MRRAWVLLALLLAPYAQAGADDPATVGSITKNNGLQRDRYIYIKTPSILRISKSKTVSPQVQAAIDNYDQAARLSPDPLIRAESLRRAADLRVQLADAGDTDAAEVKKAVAGYQRLLADYPAYVENDRVLYQLARAQQLDGDGEVAIATLRTLGRRYPDSPRMTDALFRAAELLYARGRYDEAEPEYRTVLERSGDTPYFEPAQYKYGWTLYKQAKYREAIPVFLAILERSLPQPVPDDPVQALAGVARNKSQMSGDALRVVGLSFAALGGGAAINDYTAAHGEPRFTVLLYRSLGQQMLDQRRYSDAANAYAAFIERHPVHPLAPQFQTRAIATYRDGGFADQVVREEGRYVDTYAPAAPYWGSHKPSAEVMVELRQDLGELAPWYHAKAQAEPASDPAAKRSDFIAAAGWYRKILDIYPQDPKLAEVNLLYADSLYDGGQTREAAEQYEKTAYGYPNNPKGAEAAYAAVQAWQRLGKEVPAAERPAVLRKSADASVKYADTFPTNAQAVPVLTRAAEDLYEIKDLERAVTVASRVLTAGSKGTAPAAPELRSQALGVLADAKFAQGNFGDAEGAYTQLLAVTPASDGNRKIVVEQLAASIYKQGDAARGIGDMRAAAKYFQRVGQVVPEASIRPNADYDAASALTTLQDWGAAEQSLEGFRSRYPDSPLNADVDKKLALAYQKDNKPAPAAAAYRRVAERPAENADTRREASWLAATLYDQAQQPLLAASAYESYLKTYPQPLDRSVQARRRLTEMALASGDHARYTALLHDAVNADDMAGAARTEDSKLAAAQASLELGRAAAQEARAVYINLPIAKTLPLRKKATEAAVQALNRAAGYGYADTTTAATYEIGNVYHDFGRALLNSERPAKLKGDELEQYKLLLEEQAEPFDEQAIKAHEANLQRVAQGLWNPSIRKSVDALAELAPAQYGKREQREEIYETLH